jgi:FMN-dependent NADH-azoreductase
MLLHTDPSPLYGASISRELSAAFLGHSSTAHPKSKVLVRDLNLTPFAHHLQGAQSLGASTVEGRGQ